MWRREGDMRSVAALVVLAMVAAACTQSEADTTSTVVPDLPEADTPGTVVRNSPEAKAMIDAALGGTQAVQDFALYLDLVLLPEDGGLESFYDDVRDQAMVGAGEPLELVDGYTLSPVNSLRGAVADPDGVVLPTVDLDFALLGASPALVEETRQTLRELFEIAGEPDLIQAFAASGIGEAPLLVQIATADYTQRRTHVGPGDQAEIDLSSVDAITAGDRIATVHIFGQTLPGDPEVETGLSALELFVYRWNLGLVTMLGDDDGVTTVIDDLTVAASSTAGVKPEDRRVLSSIGETSVVLSEQGQGVPRQSVLYQQINYDARRLAESDTSATEIDREAVRKIIKPYLKPLFLERRMFEEATKAELEVRGWLAESITAAGARAWNISLGGEGRHCFISVSNDDGVSWAVGSITPDYARNPSSDRVQIPFGPGSRDACTPLENVDFDSLLLALRFQRAQMACLTLRPAIRELNNPSSPLDSPDPFVEPSDSLTPFCKPILLRPRRTAGMFGDVHLTTFDQLVIQNQAAGEFLIFDNEVATVQMRTEPWEDSDSVSVATAVAARIGDHTMSIHLDTESSSGVTYIDGVLTETDRGEAVAIGGAALSWSGFGWMVVWPDGTELKVFPDTTGLVVFVTSDSTSVGMLGGDGDGIAENDRVTRAGVVMPFDRSQPTLWEEHYGVYVDSWRITQEESLFYYGPGESTETYTLEGFPASYWEVADLDPVVRDEAEAVCVDGGITRDDILEACILDVALTGEPAFAFAAYRVQSSIPPNASPLGGSVAGPSLPGTEDMLVVGDFTFEFGAEHRFIAGPQTGGCRFEHPLNADQLFASTRFTAEDGVTMDFRFEYLPPEATANGQEGLEILAQEDGNIVVWALINWEGVPLTAGSIETISRVGDTATITGTAYLNEDPLFRFTNIYQELPADARYLPFTLRVTCHPS